MPGDSCTMTFVEFSLKEGVASITGQASNRMYDDYHRTCKSIRKIHFDDINGLLRLLDTDIDTATIYTWKMDNLVLQSKLDILD